MSASSGQVSARIALLGVAAAFGLTEPRLSHALGNRTLLLLTLTVLLTGVTVVLPATSIPIAISVVMFFAVVRRIYPAPNPAQDVAAIFPFIVAAPLAWRGLRGRPPVSVALFLAWSGATLVLSFASPVVSLAGFVNLAVPMSIGLAAAREPDGLDVLRRTLVIAAGVSATYGVLQYLSPLPWDVRWLNESGFVSAGRIGSSDFRPFGTLPAPGTMALVASLSLLLVILPGSPVRGVLRAWIASSCAVVLLLSQVRSVWIATAAALLVAILGNRRRARQTTITVAIVSLVVLLFVPSKTILVDRVKTLANPSADRSYSARVGLVKSAGQLLTPFGRGLGRYSAGSRAVGGRSLDNGYLVVLGETGIIGIALLIWVLYTAARSAKQVDYPFFVFLLLVNAAGFVLGGIGAIPLWSSCGLQRAELRSGEASVAIVDAASQ